MQTIIIVLMLLAILIPFVAITLLFPVTSVNKSKHPAKKISAVENDEIFNHLF